MERGEQEAKEDMPLFDLMTISAATNDFSSDNIIGEGGFGPVYRMNERKGSFSGKIALVLQWEYQGGFFTFTRTPD